MENLGIISEEDAEEARNYDIVIAERKRLRYNAPYFTSHIIKQLIEMFGEEVSYTAGMKVYTTLDYKLQQKAESVVNKYIEYGESSHWIRSMQQKLTS